MTFQMWSQFHYIFILSPFLFAVLFYFIFKNGNQKTLRMIGVGFSLLAITLLVGRNIEIYSKMNQLTPEMIPLQICHFANFILLFAFIFKSNTLFSIAFCFNLPAAFVSIVFANSLSNYVTVLSWQGMAYLWGHMLIIGIVLWAFFNDMFHIHFKTVRKSVWIIISMFLLSIIVNNVFMKWMSPYSSNYFYTITPEKGTPLEFFYNLGEEITMFGIQFNPVYILILLIVGLSVVFLFYGIFNVLHRFKIGTSRYSVRDNKRVAE